MSAKRRNILLKLDLTQSTKNDTLPSNYSTENPGSTLRTKTRHKKCEKTLLNDIVFK